MNGNIYDFNKVTCLHTHSLENYRVQTANDNSFINESINKTKFLHVSINKEKNLPSVYRIWTNLSLPQNYQSNLTLDFHHVISKSMEVRCSSKDTSILSLMSIQRTIINIITSY